MSIFEIILLGIALAMDCFAVSLAKGISAGKLYCARILLMALLFGLFQAGMPLIGYFAGVRFAGAIASVAPWIALALLGFIGGKMIVEYFKERNSGEDDSAPEDAAGVDYSLKTLMVLSVATSIDALATGLLFVGFSAAKLAVAVTIIGVCSFVFSLLGTFAGVFVGKHFKFPAELLGGLILVGIGLKIWIEGLFF